MNAIERKQGDTRIYKTFREDDPRKREAYGTYRRAKLAEKSREIKKDKAIDKRSRIGLKLWSLNVNDSHEQKYNKWRTRRKVDVARHEQAN